MTHRRISTALTTLVAIASATMAMAQTQPAPQQQEDTSPKNASSPHQRETTGTGAQEAPTSADTSPSAASTTHQQESTHKDSQKMAHKDKGDRERMMNDCMKKEQARNSALTAADAKKSCMDQMKARGHDTMQQR